MSIDQKVADWLLSLPREECKHQAEMYCAYHRIMNKPLAFWYVKTNYECHARLAEHRRNYKQN